MAKSWLGPMFKVAWRRGFMEHIFNKCNVAIDLGGMEVTLKQRANLGFVYTKMFIARSMLW